MKNCFLFALLIVTTSHVFGSELVGEEYLSKWTGTYKITNCTSCPDFNFAGDKNLNDITEFYIGSRIVPSSELPSCATTNKDIYFDYVFESQDGTMWTNFFSHGTMCYIGYRPGITQGVSVVMTDNSFTYYRNTPQDKSYRFTEIKHISGNSYQVTQKVTQYHSRHRGVEKFEFVLEAEKK